MQAISREFRAALPWELLYADDLVVIAETEEDSIKRLNEWKNNVENRGMTVNMNKNSSGDEIANVNFFLQHRTCRGQRLRPLNEFAISTKHLRYLPTHQADF